MTKRPVPSFFSIARKSSSGRVRRERGFDDLGDDDLGDVITFVFGADVVNVYYNPNCHWNLTQNTSLHNAVRCISLPNRSTFILVDRIRVPKHLVGCCSHACRAMHRDLQCLARRCG